MDLAPQVLLSRMQELFVSSARLVYDKKKGIPFSAIERRDQLLQELRKFIEFGESLSGREFALFQMIRPLSLCFFECLYEKIFEGDWESSALTTALPEVASPREYLASLSQDSKLRKEVKKFISEKELQVFFMEAMALDKEARLRLFNGAEDVIRHTVSVPVAMTDSKTATQKISSKTQVQKVLDERPLFKTKKFWVTTVVAAQIAILAAVLGRNAVVRHYQSKMEQRQNQILNKGLSSLLPDASIQQSADPNNVSQNDSLEKPE